MPQTLGIEKIEKHPNYDINDDSSRSDIALVRVQGFIKLYVSKRSRPIFKSFKSFIEITTHELIFKKIL